MSPTKTSIIIPCLFVDSTFIDLTSACLKSLLAFGKPDQLLVIEGDSFAANVNRGLMAATGEILIVSNNDILFTPGWLAALLKPLTLGYDISSICTSDQGWATRDDITEGDKFGSLWAMKRKVYDTIGGLDESFGNYFEDLDYQKRAEDAGFRVGKNHGHLVEHLGKATFKQVDPGDAQYHAAMEKFRAKWGRVW